MIVWGGEGEWLFVGHSSRLLCHRILGVCSALNRSESIRDRNFEYVDVIVAMNNPCDRLTCSRLAFDVEREVWAPRCCVFINNISNSRIFAFRWHTTDWSTCSRSCGNGCRHAMSSAVRRSTLQIMDQAQTVLLIKKTQHFWEGSIL